MTTQSCIILWDGHLRNRNQGIRRHGSPSLHPGRKAERSQQLAATWCAKGLGASAPVQVQETDCRSCKSGIKLGQWLGLAAEKVIRYHPANVPFM